MKRPARMPLMLHGTGASDQQVRPAKVPRRPEPRRPEPQARTNVQVMPVSVHSMSSPTVTCKNEDYHTLNGQTSIIIMPFDIMIIL